MRDRAHKLLRERAETTQRAGRYDMYSVYVHIHNMYIYNTVFRYLQHRCCCPWQGAHAARLVHHDDLITLHRDDGAETCHLAPARWTARFVAEITGFQAPACPPLFCGSPRLISLASHHPFPTDMLVDVLRVLLCAFFCLRSK